MTIQRWIGGLLLLVSGLFAYRMYRNAPWMLNVTDFLVLPILQFSLPLSMIALRLCFLPSVLWRSHSVTIGLVATSLFILVLQTGWPNPQQATAWEDSYQMLFVLEVAIKGLCWPFWISLILHTLYADWRKRQS